VIETPRLRNGFIDYIRALFNAPPGFYQLILGVSLPSGGIPWKVGGACLPSGAARPGIDTSPAAAVLSKNCLRLMRNFMIRPSGSGRE
jgi:hypothetical protein